MRLPEIDFSTLEVREIGSWPLILRVGVVAACAILSSFLVYFFILSAQFDALTNAEKQLQDKKNDFKQKYNMAVNLDAYKKQMEEMQLAYKDFLKELPSSSNVPELVDSISKLGENNALKFNSIKIGDAKAAAGFYMELPITLNVVGTYHNFGKFVTDLSKLPRIVTVNDFSIKPSDKVDDPASSGILNMTLETETYWLSATDQNKPVDSTNPSNPAPTVPGVPAPPTMPGVPAPPTGMPAVPGGA